VSREQLTDELRQRLGYRRLSRGWAKVEILLGLFAAGAGLLLGQFAVSRPEPEWGFGAAGLVLFVLGGYLTLAGHRSHLYQSANERLMLLIEELRQQRR
jgi:protein-S-isoprenylcysteine O-methyltransferase Ste14